jgi:hypothetical protein
MILALVLDLQLDVRNTQYRPQCEDRCVGLGDWIQSMTVSFSPLIMST